MTSLVHMCDDLYRNDWKDRLVLFVCGHRRIRIFLYLVSLVTATSLSAAGLFLLRG